MRLISLECNPISEIVFWADNRRRNIYIVIIQPPPSTSYFVRKKFHESMKRINVICVYLPPGNRYGFPARKDKERFLRKKLFEDNKILYLKITAGRMLYTYKWIYVCVCSNHIKHNIKVITIGLDTPDSWCIEVKLVTLFSCLIRLTFSYEGHIILYTCAIRALRSFRFFSPYIPLHYR